MRHHLSNVGPASSNESLLVDRALPNSISCRTRTFLLRLQTAQQRREENANAVPKFERDCRRCAMAQNKGFERVDSLVQHVTFAQNLCLQTHIFGITHRMPTTDDGSHTAEFIPAAQKQMNRLGEVVGPWSLVWSPRADYLPLTKLVPS